MVLTMAPTVAFAADTTSDPAAQSNPVAQIKDAQKSSVYFGNYKQSSDGNGDYLTEPIKWRVLQNASCSCWRIRFWMFIIITTMAAPVEEHAKHPHSPHLFVSPKTGTMFDPDSFRHTHEKILKAIGAEHIRFHDLRHTFATLSLKYGVDVKTLSGALGHYDAGFTLSTYTHATEGMKRSAADTIGSVISQTM